MTDKQARQLVAGAGAGAITKTSVAPLERLKVIFQVQGMYAKSGAADAVKRPTTIAGAARAIFDAEGVRGFYRGNAANVLRVIPVYALKFSGNDFFRSLLSKEGTVPLTTPRLLAAGAGAGALQILATYPLDLLRTRMSRCCRISFFGDDESFVILRVSPW
jgi:hypothetical protein